MNTAVLEKKKLNLVYECMDMFVITEKGWQFLKDKKDHQLTVPGEYTAGNEAQELRG